MTNSVIQNFLVFVFFGIVASGCALEDDPSVTAKKDVEKPTLTEVSAVSSPTSDSTPNYTFSSSESGTITYGGSCSSSTTSATIGHNIITLVSLNDGTYSDCTITVTDESGNISSTLSISTFIITKPILTEITAVSSPTSNDEPNYTFNSTEAGTITYGGSCTSTTTTSVSGNNTITFSSLGEGNYLNCTITVTESSGNVSNPLSITSFVVDLVPVIEEVTTVTTPTNDTKPNYTFLSSESGTISYGGSCSSSTTSATSGNNTITFSTLSSGTYSDCTIKVTDSSGNTSSSLSVSTFVIDATAPTVSSISPTDNQTGVSVGTSISITFSESIDTSSVSTNTTGTSCSGSMQLSSDNFSSCIQISSSPSASNSNQTFSMTPSSYISAEITYKIRVLNTLKDSVGNTLNSNYTTSNGFTTVSSPVLTQVTSVSTPTNVTTPNYTFSSDVAGTISYGGSCSSSTTTATTGNNTITLNTLSDETYSNCTITVTSSFVSSTLNINTFIIDATPPTVYSVSPTDDISEVSMSDNISVTFSEVMDTNSITTNTTNTNCSGSFQLSSNNFISCVQMSSSPSNFNSDKTFTVDPSDNLSHYTNYKIRVTTGVKDSAGNVLSSQYETSSGFTSVGFTSDGFFVAVGDSGQIVTSTYGIAWNLFNESKSLMGVTYSNNLFLKAGYDGHISTSSNATSWDNRTSGTTNNLREITYGNDKFVVVGNSGTILTSSDNGSTWGARTSGINNEMNGVLYSNDTFVAVANLGKILTSSDGISWTSRTSGVNSYLQDVGFGNSTFVVVGTSGTILTSSDGISWTSRASGTSNRLDGITYGNNIFVVVGWSGTILTSSDGTTWTSKTSGTTENLSDIVYGEGKFITVGGNGTILTSSDGTTWTSRTSGHSSSIIGITYADFVKLFKVPKTGQTISYIDYDDGYYQKGRDITLVRDDTTEILTDNTTGLMWKDDTDSTTYTQVDAKTYCNNKIYQGYNDWRLATYQELSLLLDYSNSNNQRRSEVNYLDWTWTATDVINLGSDRRSLYLDPSSAKNNMPVSDSLNLKTKCVRNTNNASTTFENRFTRVNDIVFDSKTRIDWQDDSGVSNDNRNNWNDSISYCESLVLNNKSDWRLPNINEFISLRYGDNTLDYLGFSQFTRINQSHHWTSTTNPKVTTEAVYYNPNTMSIGVGLAANGNEGKDYLMQSRCVRGGQ